MLLDMLQPLLILDFLSIWVFIMRYNNIRVVSYQIILPID